MYLHGIKFVLKINVITISKEKAMSLYTMVGGHPLYVVIIMVIALAGWMYAFFSVIYMYWRLAGMDRRSRLKRKNRSKLNSSKDTERTSGSAPKSVNDDLAEIDEIIAELDAEIAELEAKLGYEHYDLDLELYYDLEHHKEVKATDRSEDNHDISKMSKN